MYTEELLADDFFTGDKPVNTRQVAVKVGQVLVAREVVAVELSTGTIVTYNEGGSGGTNVAVGIMPYAVDATAAETNASVYDAGSFNPEKLVFSGTPSAAQKASLFLGTPIALQTPQD